MRPANLLSCAVPLLVACGGGGGGTGGRASSTTAGNGGASTSGTTSMSTSTSSTASTGGSGGSTGTGGGKPVATVPYVYVGAEDDTISVFLLDRATGALALQGKVDAGKNPSFLAADPTHRRLVAVNENSSEVAAFTIEPATGLLTFKNRKSSQGSGPAYVSVDGSGAFALVANYGGGTVAVLPIQADGSLGDAVDTASPGVNPHLIRSDPSNKHVFVPCKGSDHVSQYLFNAQTGKLAPNSPASVSTAPGAGPRHLEFHGSLPVVYVINELGDTVDTYAFDGNKGTLSPKGSVTTLPAGADAASNYCADLHLRPDGKFLYGSNRGNDSIAIFAVDAATGALTPAGHQPTGGSWPRNFGIDPEGGIMLVANQHSNNVVTFRIDGVTGALTPLVTTATDGAPSWVGVITQPVL